MTFDNKKLHLIYFLGLALVIVINVIVNPQATFANWIEIMGTILQIAVPVYAAVPLLAKKDKQGAKQFVWFFLSVLAVTYLLKFSIPEKRPYGGPMSFPSGHTAAVFAGSLFLSIRYGWKYFVCTAPVAIFVAFSRVYSLNHWPIDVFAAVVICCVLGFVFVSSYKKQMSNPPA